MEPYVLEHLTKHGIKYELHSHPAIFSAKQERPEEMASIIGTICKNLFLKDKETGKQILVILELDKRLDMEQLQEHLEIKKLGFCKPKEVKEKLGVDPGSVSPLSLINNKENDIHIIIDYEIWNAGIVVCHPNINTESLTIPNESFKRLMESFENEQEVIDLL
jgi:Ala-tRNA(Pro) deacylase